ncbi:MAG: hypothetical protein OER91_10310 [Gammaproteobacteria bacterium]|nr:hypothetical protein [Gammaproteobacteria bacterium]
MLWILFTLFAIAHLALLVASFRLAAGAPEWLLRALLFGLIADNAIIAAGAAAFDAPWYYATSEFRYLAHVILLPPMVLAALALLRRAGSVFATRRATWIVAAAFVVVAISYGVATEIVGLELVRESLLGHDRYTSVDAAPPLATIVTNLAILVMAAMLWRIGRFPWLFVASLTIFVVNGATATSDWGIVAGNFAELVFVAGWLASLYRFPAD